VLQSRNRKTGRQRLDLVASTSIDIVPQRISNEIADRASRVAWRPGQLHALRPVFRELDNPAAFVHEALEHPKGAEAQL